MRAPVAVSSAAEGRSVSINTGVHVWHIPPCVVAVERRAADWSVAEGPVAHQSSWVCSPAPSERINDATENKTMSENHLAWYLSSLWLTQNKLHTTVEFNHAGSAPLSSHRVKGQNQQNKSSIKLWQKNNYRICPQIQQMDFWSITIANTQFIYWLFCTFFRQQSLSLSLFYCF